jgi:hypothetical protein
VEQVIAGVRPGGGNRPDSRPPGWSGSRPGWGYPGYGLGAAAVGGAAWAAGDCYYYGTCGGSYGGDYYAESDGVEACARRFKTYDRVSQTYIAKGGKRVACP